jgi:hypothetical protein
MKKKLVEKTAPIETRKKKPWITVQIVEDIMVLNMYNQGNLCCRHCVNIETGEYATLKDGVWYETRIGCCFGVKPYEYYWSCSNDFRIKNNFNISEKDERLIVSTLPHPTYMHEAFNVIDYVEYEYGRNKRENKENRRIQRVNDVMNLVPDIPEDIEDWLGNIASTGINYATPVTNEPGRYCCSSCGKKMAESQLRRTDKEKKVRHNDMIDCKWCKKSIKLIKRKTGVRITTRFGLIQNIDDGMSVARHFDAQVICAGEKRKVVIDEAVRVIMYKKSHSKKCTLYYNQYSRFNLRATMPTNTQSFDNKSNWRNRKMDVEYLYSEDLEEAFKDTYYEPWTRLFSQLIAAGKRLDYNRMMSAAGEQNYIDLVEMLFKGKFNKLLEEASQNVSLWSEQYCGKLKLYGNTIEDAFDIGDRQKINRIREIDGGEAVLDWMRYSDETDEKISDKALRWLVKEKLDKADMKYIIDVMSVEKAMNYLQRQQKESYKGKTIKTILGQYKDYRSMCQMLHKKWNDEMIFRPRELKRRHDECVLELERRNAEIKAEEYSKKYKEAESVLQEIVSKYEYSGEEYFITVPKRIVDIVTEGNALHHCAGSTDRYFDRIKQHETYICFLRKVSEPDVPFYTIEVEPGGTIRQHRGMFDEEPDIEKIKPFLREWQKEVKKRMSKKDKKLAEVSKIKREQNIQELKEKNNTKVLNGLMEDFMEAV